MKVVFGAIFEDEPIVIFSEFLVGAMDIPGCYFLDHAGHALSDESWFDANSISDFHFILFWWK